MVNLSKIYGWFTRADWVTWIGHALIGALIAAVGVLANVDDIGISYAVLAAFVYRELSDLLAWAIEDKATRRPLGAKLRDGFLDLWAPLIGAALAVLLLR
jgi:predicted branched-subunit amino acid permease